MQQHSDLSCYLGPYALLTSKNIYFKLQFPASSSTTQVQPGMSGVM